MGKVIRDFCWHQKFVPKGLYALAPGLYTFWNLQHMGKEKRPFCCYQNFVPNVLSAPAQGYIHEKNVSKIRLQRDCFKTCNKWAKWWLSVDINIWPQGVVCLCPGAIYMYKSIKIYTSTRCQVSVYRTTGPLVWAMSQQKLFIPYANNKGADQHAHPSACAVWLAPLLFAV